MIDCFMGASRQSSSQLIFVSLCANCVFALESRLKYSYPTFVGAIKRYEVVTEAKNVSNALVHRAWILLELFSSVLYALRLATPLRCLCSVCSLSHRFVRDRRVR